MAKEVKKKHLHHIFNVIKQLKPRLLDIKNACDVLPDTTDSVIETIKEDNIIAISRLPEISNYLLAISRNESIAFNSFWSLNNKEELEHFLVDFTFDIMTEDTDCMFYDYFTSTQNFHHSPQHLFNL